MDRQEIINNANKYEKVMQAHRDLSEVATFNKAKVMFFHFIKVLDVTWEEWATLTTNQKEND